MAALPSLPNEQANYVATDGKPTPEFYSFLRRLLVAVTPPVAMSSTTVGSLPAAATNTGTRYIVTNANATTFMSIVAAGGVNIVPVFSDGTNWRIG